VALLFWCLALNTKLKPTKEFTPSTSWGLLVIVNKTCLCVCVSLSTGFSLYSIVPDDFSSSLSFSLYQPPRYRANTHLTPRSRAHKHELTRLDHTLIEDTVRS